MLVLFLADVLLYQDRLELRPQSFLHHLRRVKASLDRHNRSQLQPLDVRGERGEGQEEGDDERSIGRREGSAHFDRLVASGGRLF